MRHLLSFARSPIGYALNFIVTILVYAERIPGMRRAAMLAGDYLSIPCEALCARDGVQDDMLF